jgi:signal transduction histidine kinase
MDIAKILLIDLKQDQTLRVSSSLSDMPFAVFAWAQKDEILAKIEDNLFDLILINTSDVASEEFSLAEKIRVMDSCKQTNLVFICEANVSDLFIEKASKLVPVDFLVRPFKSNLLKVKIAHDAFQRNFQIEKKTIGEQLVKVNHELQEKNKALSAFVGAVTHDLQAPLNSVERWAEELFNHSEPIVVQKAEQILNKIDHMKNLIRSFLDYAKSGNSIVEMMKFHHH